jgi:glycerol-3-phosphate acyltransferase PlsY
MFMTVLFVVLGYLAGSISTAILVCRAMGLPDPRSEGSRNPGATNVLRFGGKKAAAITLAGDFLKGVLPVLLAQLAGLDEIGLALTGLAAFLGHLYPVFFAFEGGKGVATAAGVLLGLDPWLGAATLGAWLLVAFATRYSSLAAIVAAGFAPLFHLLVRDGGEALLCIVPMSLLLVWRHGANIRKLVNGTESKIGHKASAQGAAVPTASGRKAKRRR